MQRRSVLGSGACLQTAERRRGGKRLGVADGDRVFVYYSGHGSTKQVAQTCQASLVTYEGEDYLSSELHAALQSTSAVLLEVEVN